MSSNSRNRKREKPDGPSCGCRDVSVSTGCVKVEAREAVKRRTGSIRLRIGQTPLSLAIDRNGKKIPVKYGETMVLSYK
jgi:hypothetical protein